VGDGEGGEELGFGVVRRFDGVGAFFAFDGGAEGEFFGVGGPDEGTFAGIRDADAVDAVVDGIEVELEGGFRFGSRGGFGFFGWGFVGGGFCGSGFVRGRF
jgi:hypothetical protein